jgi:hypothetical protein
MKIGDSVRRAIEDWEKGELESAMLHACNAVDGTAKKRYPKEGNNARFTRLIRENYHIFGPMGAPGIDLAATRWPVRVDRPKAPGGEADIADVIYGIHRCSHGHGDELPGGFELLPDAAGPDRHTRMQVQHGKVQLSDRVIFGLLALAVLAPENSDQRVPDDYYLSFAGERFPINEWWGRMQDFAQVVAKEKMPLVKLDFSTWKGQF